MIFQMELQQSCQKVAQWMPGLIVAATRLPKVMDLGPRNLAATQGVAT